MNPEIVEMIRLGLLRFRDRPKQMRDLMQVYEIEYSRAEVEEASKQAGVISNFRQAMQELDDIRRLRRRASKLKIWIRKQRDRVVVPLVSLWALWIAFPVICRYCFTWRVFEWTPELTRRVGQKLKEESRKRRSPMLRALSMEAYKDWKSESEDDHSKTAKRNTRKATR